MVAESTALLRGVAEPAAGVAAAYVATMSLCKASLYEMRLHRPKSKSKLNEAKSCCRDDNLSRFAQCRKDMCQRGVQVRSSLPHSPR
jgi:hypothetical protein